MTDPLIQNIQGLQALALHRRTERTVTGFATDTVFDIDNLRAAMEQYQPLQLTSLGTNTPYMFLLIGGKDHFTDTFVHCLYVGFSDRLLPEAKWHQLHNRLTITCGEDGKIFVRPGWQA
ncbi:MAG TPA: hypothetical protein VLF59_06095 [Candidatus Saccharimonadales bacterium]|nr:hypothetical protein [Candidatus Saccharimonadales bacterium]